MAFGENQYDQRVKLTLDTKEFKKQSNFVRNALGGLVTAAAFKGVVGITSEIQDLNTAMKAVTGSAQAATQAKKFITDFAVTSQFSVRGLNKSYISLVANGMKPTLKFYRTLADAAAVTTGNQEDALKVLTQLYARSQGGGLNLQELEKLSDRGLPVYDILTEKLGLARNEITKFARTAQGSKRVREALFKGFEDRFSGASLDRLSNLSTAISNLSIKGREVAGVMGEEFSPGLNKVLGSTTELLEEMKPFAELIGKTLNTGFEVLNGLIEVATRHSELFSGAVAAATVGLGAKGMLGTVGLATKAIRGMTGAQLGFNRAVRANPYILIGSVLVGLGVTLYSLKDSSEDFTKTLSDGIQKDIDKVLELQKEMRLIKSGMGGLPSITKGVVLDGGPIGPPTAREMAIKQISASLSGQQSKVQNQMTTPDGASVLTGDYGTTISRIGSPRLTPTALGSSRDDYWQDKWRLQQSNAEAGFKPIGHISTDTTMSSKDESTFDSFKQGLMSETELLGLEKENQLAILDGFRGKLKEGDEEYYMWKDEISAKYDKIEADRLQARVDSNVSAITSGNAKEINIEGMKHKEFGIMGAKAGREALSIMANQNKKAFELNKAVSLIEIGVNTAQAVTKVMSQTGVGAPLAIPGIIALGAAQAAVVASSTYPGKATGGVGFMGQTYAVNEYGQETLTLPFAGARINSVEDSKKIGGGGPTEINYNIKAFDGQSVDQLLRKRQGLITSMHREAMMENGEY